MPSSTPAPARRARLALLALSPFLLVGASLTGCAVVTVAGAAVGLAATGASLAVDVTVGTTKAVAAGVGAVLPSREDGN